MIEVRIRHENDMGSMHLCTWPADGIDDLIPALKQWGIVDHRTGAAYSIDDKYALIGQVALDQSHGYFEVTICEDPNDE